MVVEEKFVTGYRVPALQAVGWEGNILQSSVKKTLSGKNYILIVDKEFKALI